MEWTIDMIVMKQNIQTIIIMNQLNTHLTNQYTHQTTATNPRIAAVPL
jgi:hypothetical protein